MLSINVYIIYILTTVNAIMLCVIAFSQCDNVLETNCLKGEKFSLAHSFRDFSPWLLGSVALGLS
jgi:hypothetical protein